MSMYVRVKREKLTVFLHVDPTDTVANLKLKLQELLQQPAEAQQLYKEGAALEEGRSLAELGVENDDELAVAYRGADGEWEEAHVEHFGGGGGGGGKDDGEAGGA